MSQIKPKIKEFVWHEHYMAVHWDKMERAFKISKEWGDAGLLIPSPLESSYPSVQAGIDLAEIRQFVLRQDLQTGQTEVILEVSYGSGQECLGLTEQVDVAQQWITEANHLINRARERHKD